MGGALGGIVSYLVFSRFPSDPENQDNRNKAWKSWQILFLLEGSLTIAIALIGFAWLPHSPSTAWFLNPQERQWAEERVVLDRSEDAGVVSTNTLQGDEENEDVEETRGLLNQGQSPPSASRTLTDDRGLTPHDVVSAFLSPKIYHILFCNILSAVPVYAFSVFLPLVLAPLTESPSPALVNLLTAPPYICGAATLYVFASYSDRTRRRFGPILSGLGILTVGLIFVVMLPQSKPWVIPRYLALNVLLSGTFVASPLTVAWISGNTPSPGKRALLLGINGWGNLAGCVSALLFRKKYASNGYIVPFWWTLCLVAIAAGGFSLFWRNIRRENERRAQTLRKWDAAEVEMERREGLGPLKKAVEGGREGDDKITFVYGL